MQERTQHSLRLALRWSTCWGIQCHIGPKTQSYPMYAISTPSLDARNNCSSVFGFGQAVSDFVRSVTSLPLEATLISLPPAPLLELVCLAASRQLTSVWLALVSRLVVQLQPPSFISLKAEAEGDTKQLVDQAAQSIIVSSMRVLQVPGVMEEVWIPARPSRVCMPTSDLLASESRSCPVFLLLHGISEHFFFLYNMQLLTFPKS